VSGTLTKQDLLKRLAGRRRKPAPTAAPAAFHRIPFHLGSCTLVEAPTPEEQEAFNRHIDTFRTRAACWEHAPYADRMLDMLRSEFHHVEIAPERELRTFALECLDGLSGADDDKLRGLVATVWRRINRDASLEELAAVQKRTQACVTPGGVQGLPRLNLYAAGALAAWHTATPHPYDAAFWTAEFAALYSAFAAVQEAVKQHPPSSAAPAVGKPRSSTARTRRSVVPRVCRRAVRLPSGCGASFRNRSCARASARSGQSVDR
jgi:hypothetical protein